MTETESFNGFEHGEIPPSRGLVHAVVGGSGPPLLLLHVCLSWPPAQWLG